MTQNRGAHALVLDTHKLHDLASVDLSRASWSLCGRQTPEKGELAFRLDSITGLACPAPNTEKQLFYSKNPKMKDRFYVTVLLVKEGVCLTGKIDKMKKRGGKKKEADPSEEEGFSGRSSGDELVAARGNSSQGEESSGGKSNSRKQ